MSKKIIRTISWPLVAINAISALVMVTVGLFVTSGKQNDGNEGRPQFMFDGIQRAMADTPHSSDGGGSGGGGGVSSNCVGGSSNCDGTSSGSDSSGDSK